MIHFTKATHSKKLGLNLYRAPYGFVALWLWYDFATYESFFARFRLRLHIRPWIMWSTGRANVIEEHLDLYDLDLVPREVLKDLSLLEADIKRTNEPYAYIKPQ